MTEWARTVQAPDGRSFTVFIAAPGSLLDSGDEGPQRMLARFGFRLVAPVVAFVAAFFTGRAMARAAGRSWRLAVNPLVGWHLKDTVYRERVPDQASADARSAELGELIRTGAWDPGTRLPPPPSATDSAAE